jgi:hypothetical protein
MLPLPMLPPETIDRHVRQPRNIRHPLVTCTSARRDPP